ncbi:MAG: MFS transporter [Prolixibacteraceae bacterium]|jgi:maltose/moltooligosaccharide transporter|nr:MFS transporter [Prolixibacteraceae bacterium]
MAKKPMLSFWQIWNMSFGFMGVQIGYSLQNGNTSRILSALGSDVGHLSYFWLAAPLAGLIVQPIIGLSSDRTWTRLGRRIPFILAGAIVSALAMFFMPNSEFFAHLVPPLFFGASMLLLMDTSFNVTMQPFRSLVGDMVSEEQRNIGFSMQAFLINAGAVVGSILPFLLTWLGVSNIPNPGEKVAPTVVWAFYFGGGALLLSVLWTSFTTREYTPEEHARYNNRGNEERKKSSFPQLLKDTPKTMLQLAFVQFFSWFSLFLMWVYTTPAIAENVWNTVPGDATSGPYNEAANWVGIIFAAYSVFGAIFSLLMARLATRLGRKTVYLSSLLAGGLGLLSIVLVKDQYGLIASMVGVGIAWAAILAMPYAMLSASLPAEKMGVYMGIFNATITIPQIAAGLLGATIFKLMGGHAVYMLGLSGISMVIAGISVIFIKEHKYSKEF